MSALPALVWRALLEGEPLVPLALVCPTVLEDEGLEGEARELLTAACRALGRDALAAIVEVHYAHRDLRSVDLYLRG